MTINLSPQELQKANRYAEKIDLTNSALVMQYAAPVQRKITSYSSQALDIASSNASTEATEIINQLIEKISTFASPRKGFFGLAKKDASDWRKDYQSVSGDIKQLSLQLEKLQFQLYKDMGLYQQMSKQNMEARQELMLYMQAGQTKLETAKKLELPMLETKRNESQAPQDQMRLASYQGQVQQFEEKLRDLQVTKVISEQFELQLELMYQTAKTLTDKLQSTLIHTIPLWQNQVAIALGLDRIAQAREAERAMDEIQMENPAEKISQLTEHILQDMSDQKTELQQLGQD